MQVSKTCERELMSVRLRPAARMPHLHDVDRKVLAYVVGAAIGDGNLSNPNRGATRLRITCDVKYKSILRRICRAIQTLLPHNKVSLVRRPKNCVDISCYSNRWERWLGWKADKGPKYRQQVSVPRWIQNDKRFIIPCLQGLIETDGSIYYDRAYKMVNFVTMLPSLATDVMAAIAKLGFTAHLYKIPQSAKIKHTIRVSKNVDEFLEVLGLAKKD